MFTAEMTLGTQENGTIVYRQAIADRRNYTCDYTVKSIPAAELDSLDNLPFYAWPGGYEMAYYVTSDNLTDGPYCASCAHQMARSGNYYDMAAEESGGILAEITDSWDCPDNCANCHCEIGPSMHCGPRLDNDDCAHCGRFITEGQETALQAS
jgi:hypothetical protein